MTHAYREVDVKLQQGFRGGAWKKLLIYDVFCI